MVHGNIGHQAEEENCGLVWDTVIERLSKAKRNNLPQNHEENNTPGRRQDSDEYPGLTEEGESVEDQEEEEQERIDVLEHGQFQHYRADQRIVNRKESEKEEPAQVVSTVLEAHHFHTLAGFGFALAGKFHGNVDKDDDEGVEYERSNIVHQAIDRIVVKIRNR